MQGIFVFEMPERERLLAEKVDGCQLRYSLNSQNSIPLGMILCYFERVTPAPK